MVREAGLLHQFGRYAEAVLAYRRVLETNESPHFASTERGIHGYLTRHNLAVVYSDMRQWSAAEVEWHHVIAEAPEFRAAWSGLAMALLQLGDHRGAAAAWLKLTHLDPQDACAHHNLGTTRLPPTPPSTLRHLPMCQASHHRRHRSSAPATSRSWPQQRNGPGILPGPFPITPSETARSRRKGA